ncbi:MAG: methylcrotonoyl-CoA carboxylase, partial [Deltaproteobacteria bacterium]|nr:methylcrotonoyl-CoA carboxylase [Deltaproteobacteria bacterium]
SIERLKALRKLPVEERLALVLDRALLELSPLAGYNVYDTKPGANIRCVIGLIGQNPVMVIANDPSVKGGTYYPLTIKKHLRAQEIAETLNLPCLYLVDSGGAYLPMQEEVFPDKFHFGRLFFNQCRMSAKGNIQISVTLGSATAGGAYIPALSDISIIVQNTGHIFLGGPPLVKAATGLNVTAEELGGAKVHTDISGVADIRVENEEKGFELVKKLVGNLKPKSANFELNQAKSVPPRYDPLEIPYFLSENTNYGREILGRLLDDSYLDEFKPTFGETIICGFGRICGFLVGILMNDGILYSESAIKSTHFIQLCNKLRIPIIFLQNIVGFMVGTEYEHKGIAKDGAKMVSAVANSVVPKITVIIGASYGAGNYGMCGRAFDPVFLFAWPNSRIGVMGGKQAGIVLSLVGSQKDDIESFKKSIEEEYDKKTSAFYGTARLWDDGLILAEQTREVLKNCLSLLEGFEIREDFKPTYRF